MKIVKNAVTLVVCACSVAFLWSAFLWIGCTSKSNSTGPTDTIPKQDTIPKDTIPQAVYSTIFADTSDFYKADAIGFLSPDTLKEASGLAASRNYPGLLWTHNDSGNPNDIFLIDSAGNVVETFFLDGVSNRDWEDIASGPGPTPGLNYVYVGEIGDNNADHSSSWIYRLVEPSGPIDAGSYQHITKFDKINFNYPDGPRNAETLMLDPVTLDLYVASKEGLARVYEASYPQPINSLFTMKEVAIQPLYKLTGGDISSGDGSEILMCSNDYIYYWKRTAGESVAAALLQQPMTVPYGPEAQGEAVCWSLNNDAYFTTSEYADNVVAPLYIYRRKK